MFNVYIPGWGFNSDIWKNLEKSGLFLELPSIKFSNLNYIAEYLSKQIPENSNLVGWSLGGLIAIKLCTLFPNKFNKIVLVATTPKFIAEPNWEGISHQVMLKFIFEAKQNFPRLIKNFFSQITSGYNSIKIENYLKIHLQNIIDQKLSWYKYLEILFNTDLRSEYSRISIPILHIFGKQDNIIKVNQQTLTALNNNITMAFFENSGHAPFLTNSKLFADKIKNFLNYDL